MAHWVRQHAWCELNYSMLALSVCGCTCKDTVGGSPNQTVFDSYDPDNISETNCYSGAAEGECPNICDQICSEYNHTAGQQRPPLQLGSQRRRQPYTPAGRKRGEGRPPTVGVAYKRGGKANSNKGRFSGRTQSNPKGRPKK